MDKRTCETLIQGILDEKKIEDNRKNIRQLERLIHRNKTVDRHNQCLEYQKMLGIKIVENKTSRNKSNATMQANAYRMNTQEFSDFENSQMKTSARLNNSTLVRERADSPLLNNEVQKTN